MQHKTGILQRTDVGCYTGVDEPFDTKELAEARIVELKLLHPYNEYVMCDVTIEE